MKLKAMIDVKIIIEVRGIDAVKIIIDVKEINAVKEIDAAIGIKVNEVKGIRTIKKEIIKIIDLSDLLNSARSFF